TTLVSIICTVKNGMNTLPLTIDSIRNQSYQNWELIIVDDGSEDKTDLIIKNYVKEDTRIKPIFTDGIGRGKSLNRAIENSSGELLANIDADDMMHPKRIEKQVEYFKLKPDIFLLCSDFTIIYDNELPTWTKLVDYNVQTIEIESGIL